MLFFLLQYYLIIILPVYLESHLKYAVVYHKKFCAVYNQILTVFKRELSDLSENRVNATLSRVCVCVCVSRNDQVE